MAYFCGRESRKSRKEVRCAESAGTVVWSERKSYGTKPSKRLLSNPLESKERRIKICKLSGAPCAIA